LATPAEISNLYNQYLGRDPLQSGVDAWLSTGQSIDQIEQGIANSPEAAVYETYQETLGREPEMEERKAWVTEINNTGSIQQAVDSIATSPEAQSFEAKNDALTTALTEVANSPDTLGLGINKALNDDRPDPVIQGTDGQYYLTNAELTPNGWVTNPDYSTPVYFFHQPIEAGKARENYAEYSEDYKSAKQQGFWFTEEQIEGFWTGESETAGQMNMHVFREQHPNMDFDQYISFVNENSALYAQGFTPENNAEVFSTLTDKYNIKTSFASEAGHLYGWNGSNYVKTFYLDKSFDVGNLIMSLGVAAMTGGLASEGVLGSFLQGLSGFQRTAVLNGVSAAVQSGGDVKAIAGSVVGTLAGGQLGSYIDLGSSAANAALSSSISSAFEQAIVTGDIDFETVLTSGAVGGATEIGANLAQALATGGEFDFGGLLSPDSELFTTLNGTYENVTGEWTGGLIGNARGTYKEFVEQYITGGDWWESATESYADVDIFTDSKGNKTVDLIGYDGSVKTGIPWETFVSQGFDEISGTSAIWDSVSGALGAIPDNWYDTLFNWVTTSASSSGGTHTTESGSTVTVSTAGADDDGGAGGDDTSDDFNCSSVNRQQVAGATIEEECGACIEGYQSDEFGECVAVIDNKVCEEGETYNDVIGACVPEIFFTQGQPCNKEDGTQGVFDADGNCVDSPSTKSTVGTGGKAGDACSVERTGEAGTIQDDGQGNLTCVATTTVTGGTGGTGGKGATKKAGDSCTDEVTNQQGTLQDDGQGNLICVVSGDTTTVGTESTVTQTCSDPNRSTKEDGSCAELCNDGTIPDQHEEGLCGNPLIVTTTGETTTTTECANNATTESDCTKCADNSLASDHEEGNCNNPLITTTTGNTTHEEGNC
jgi:hypothetical protein